MRSGSSRLLLQQQFAKLVLHKPLESKRIENLDVAVEVKYVLCNETVVASGSERHLCSSFEGVPHLYDQASDA